MIVDDFGTVAHHAALSGPSLNDCVLIGHRHEFEQPPRPESMESWVIWSTVDASGGPYVQFPFGIVGWLTDIWLTPNRVVYVTDLEGRLFVEDLDRCSLDNDWTPRVEFGSDVRLHGIWGLDDDNLYLWASDANSTFLLHGCHAQWRRIPGPGFDVSVLRGTSPTDLLAGGTSGEVARWNGIAWTSLPTAGSTVTGIAVVDSERFWLSTQAGGVFEGRGEAVVERARTVGAAPLADVALWQGRIWLAAQGLGLLRLVEASHELEFVKPNIPVFRFDGRQDLVMCCPDLVACTHDRTTFQGTIGGSFASARGAIPPDWEG